MVVTSAHSPGGRVEEIRWLAAAEQGNDVIPNTAILVGRLRSIP